MWRYLRRRVKKSFTDTIWFIDFVMVNIYTIVCVLAMLYSLFTGVDTNVAAMVMDRILVCAWAELGVFSACIVNKALKENLNKDYNGPLG